MSFVRICAAEALPSILIRPHLQVNREATRWANAGASCLCACVCAPGELAGVRRLSLEAAPPPVESRCVTLHVPASLLLAARASSVRMRVRGVVCGGHSVRVRSSASLACAALAVRALLQLISRASVQCCDRLAAAQWPTRCLPLRCLHRRR